MVLKIPLRKNPDPSSEVCAVSPLKEKDMMIEQRQKALVRRIYNQLTLSQYPKHQNFIISISKGPEFHYFNIQRTRISLFQCPKVQNFIFLLLSKGPEFHYLNIQMIRINYFSVLRSRISLFLSKGQEFHYLNIQRSKMSLF